MTQPERSEPETRSIRRVLVALDPMAQCQAALDTAARIAARAHAELVGLFVEDLQLLQAADLPVTRIVRSYDTVEETDAAAMARGLRTWAARAEATLSATGARWRVKTTFQVARGAVAEVLLAEAGHSDLLALGAVARPMRARRLGGTARALARTATCPVLVMRGEGPKGAPVLLLYEGNPRALALAVELAGLGEAGLTVLASGKAQAEEAAAWCDKAGLRASVEALESNEAVAVRAALEKRPVSLVILDRSAPLGAALDAGTLLGGPTAALLVLG